jgi:hypothetical protein
MHRALRPGVLAVHGGLHDALRRGVPTLCTVLSRDGAGPDSGGWAAIGKRDRGRRVGPAGPALLLARRPCSCSARRYGHLMRRWNGRDVYSECVDVDSAERVPARARGPLGSARGGTGLRCVLRSASTACAVGHLGLTSRREPVVGPSGRRGGSEGTWGSRVRHHQSLRARLRHARQVEG